MTENIGRACSDNFMDDPASNDVPKLDTVRDIEVQLQTEKDQNVEMKTKLDDVSILVFFPC